MQSNGFSKGQKSHLAKKCKNKDFGIIIIFLFQPNNESSFVFKLNGPTSSFHNQNKIDLPIARKVWTQ